MQSAYYARKTFRYAAYASVCVVLAFILGLGGPCGGLGFCLLLPALGFVAATAIFGVKWLLA
jgi:hypothetical protein